MSQHCVTVNTIHLIYLASFRLPLPIIPRHSIQDILRVNHDRHRIAHQITRTLHQVPTPDETLIVPRTKIVRSDGVVRDEGAVA
jgi:hypothetical protein